MQPGTIEQRGRLRLVAAAGNPVASATTAFKTPDRLRSPVEPIADRTSNPFGMSLPCERAVESYGDVAANFHVVGDHPGVHGGLAANLPFTGMRWSNDFLGALVGGDLLREWTPETGDVTVEGTFLSYLYPCAEDDDGAAPAVTDYDRLEPFFDAELRAITADVLLPVGEQATAHVLATYTARDGGPPDMASLHATEVRGSGWLVVPIRHPGDWDPGDRDALVATLQALRARDFRQRADLGRFLPGADPYMVR